MKPYSGEMLRGDPVPTALLFPQSKAQVSCHLPVRCDMSLLAQAVCKGVGMRGIVSATFAGGPGTGKTVQPAGVTVPDAGRDVQNWTSVRNLTIDGRRYDFIVDRSTQPWWPGDFNQGGYLGRWGPRVETDPFGRRAGMRFPAFWRLFFLAFANGKASGAL